MLLLWAAHLALHYEWLAKNGKAIVISDSALKRLFDMQGKGEGFPTEDSGYADYSRA